MSRWVTADRATQTHSMRLYALGRKGNFPLKRAADGYTWEAAAGPGTIASH